MAELLIKDPAELNDLTVAQINELGRHSLAWDSRWVESMYSRDEAGPTYRYNGNNGHADYRLLGYPGGYGGQTFSSRREYLTHRLRIRIRNAGFVCNADGAEKAKAEKAAFDEAKKAAAEAKKAAERKALEERATTPQTDVEVVVKASLAERIPNYSKPHKINLFNIEEGRVCLHKASSSEGHEICEERIFVKKDALTAGIRALKDNRDALKSLPQFKLGKVEGVTFTEPQVGGITVQGDNPFDKYRSSYSNLTFSWDSDNDDHIFMEVQQWAFRFHIDDFSHVINTLNQKWSAVSDDDQSAKVTVEGNPGEYSDED